MTKPRALIVGAGIAGLAAAWWLDKAGWSSIIVERAPSFRVGGYLMTISGLGDTNGRELCRLNYADVHGGLEALAVRRDDLAQLLAKALPDSSSVRFEETVSKFTDTGTNIHTVLAGGDVIESDLLIGADGFRSKIRENLFKGKESSHLQPLGYHYAAYTFHEEVQAHNNCHSFNSPGHLDMLFALGDKGTCGMHIWCDDREMSPENTQAKFKLLREITAEAVPQVREAIDRADKASASPSMDTLSLVALPRWSCGRVLLLGDAAHCLTLLSGQGAGMALVSAEILGKELLKTSDVSQALLNHEAKLRPSIERLQSRSRKIAAWYIPKSMFTYYIRNFLLRLMPYSWLVSYHINTLKSEIDLT